MAGSGNIIGTAPSEADRVDGASTGASTFENRTYSYLRTAIVCLLVSLGVAVFYESWRQDGFLPSVSAYYYTPAQSIFVGALIGLGACTIALKGTTVVEDVFLNIAGMFAAVVAVVPTSRGHDFEEAVRACKKETADQNCPSVQALTEATEASVKNNVAALIAVAVLGLLATILIARRLKRAAPAYREPAWGFWVAVPILLALAVAFFAFTEWFINHAHYVAAVGLFVCILVVAMENATRGEGKRLPSSLKVSNRYSWIAWAMVVVAGGGIVLLVAGAISLFILEILVALLFAVFWAVQTVEQLPG